MIQNLVFGSLFFENIISGMQLFYICSNVPVNIRVLLISAFLAESLKASKNQRKRSLILRYSFSQKTSLVLGTSTHLSLKIICSHNTAKSLSDLKIFQQTCFCLVPEKIFELHHFLTPKNCIFLALLKANVCIFLYISVRYILFQRRKINFIQRGGGGGGLG